MEICFKMQCATANGQLWMLVRSIFESLLTLVEYSKPLMVLEQHRCLHAATDDPLGTESS